MEAINTSCIVYPYNCRHLGLFLVEGEALQYHHNKAYGNDDSKFNEGVLTEAKPDFGHYHPQTHTQFGVAVMHCGKHGHGER